MKPTRPDLEALKSALCASRSYSRQDFEKVWKILEEMLILFYPPFYAVSEDELLRQCALSLRAYCQDLAQFSETTLEDGWREARRRHKVPRWPAIADILEQCQRIDERKPVAKPTAIYPRVEPWQRALVAIIGADSPEDEDRRAHQQGIARCRLVRQGGECVIECPSSAAYDNLARLLNVPALLVRVLPDVARAPVRLRFCPEHDDEKTRSVVAALKEEGPVVWPALVQRAA